MKKEMSRYTGPGPVPEPGRQALLPSAGNAGRAAALRLSFARILIWMVCLAGILLTAGTWAGHRAFAAGTSTLTIHAVYDGKGVSGISYHAFKAADVTASADGRSTAITFTEAFKEIAAKTGIDLNALSQKTDWKDGTDKLKQEALTAEVYARMGGNPVRFPATDANGNASLTLTDGIYLVYGTYTGSEYNASEVTIQPFFVWAVSSLTGNRTVDVTNVNSKISLPAKPVTPPPTPVTPPPTPVTPPPTTISVTAQKVWVGTNTNQPKYVMVQLVDGSGAVIAEKKLNKKNNWTYTWTGLDAKKTWLCAEKNVPQGYTVSISTKVLTAAKTCVLTNTYRPVPAASAAAAASASASSVSGGSSVRGVKLPQTGQLWWPVPFLALGGIFLILAGMWTSRERSV